MTYTVYNGHNQVNLLEGGAGVLMKSYLWLFEQTQTRYKSTYWN